MAVQSFSKLHTHGHISTCTYIHIYILYVVLYVEYLYSEYSKRKKRKPVGCITHNVIQANSIITKWIYNIYARICVTYIFICMYKNDARTTTMNSQYALFA